MRKYAQAYLVEAYLTRRFLGGGGGNKLVKLVPGVHNGVKSGFFELYFLVCLSWTHKWKSANSFLSLGSYLNMYHGYASLKKSTFCLFSLKKSTFSAYFEGREKH